MVYTYLEPTEAAAFRWAGRVVAEIGLQYLAPTVYLKLNEESYDRLLVIAEHPVVSKYVVSLNYETRGLHFLNREEFDYRIPPITAIPQQHNPSEGPDSLMSARARRAYERDSVLKLRSKEQMTQQWNRVWSKYEASYSRQKVELAKFFHAKTVKALRQFRNLKTISTSPYGAYERYIAGILEPFPTYCFPESKYPLILDATSPILLAAASAGLQVDNLCCQPLSWRVFTHNKEDLAVFKKGMLRLKTMDIAFTGQGMGAILRIPDSRLAQREHLAEGRVPNLITSVPDLEYLGLTFKPPASSLYLTIDVIIGKFYWSSLKAVRLEGLSSDENDLVDFCKRHRHTLKDLSLKNMELCDGSWDAAFHKIRQAFRLGQQLDSCKLCGIFLGPGGQKLDLGLRGEEGDNAGRIFSDYIRATNVGDISLGEYYEAMGLK